MEIIRDATMVTCEDHGVCGCYNDVCGFDTPGGGCNCDFDSPPGNNWGC